MLPLLLCSYVLGGLQFLTIGDWGGSEKDPYTTVSEIENGQGMAITANKLGASFVLALGDNFYHSGIGTDFHDQRFQSTFENAFNESALSVPWYVIAGNHDHVGNVSAQIAYTSLSARWNFPYYWFKKSFSFEEDGETFTIDIVMFDSVILSGPSYHDEELDVFFKANGSEHPVLASAQWEFLEQSMKESTADFLLLASHYPVWSVCSHGPTKELVTYLLPLMKQYKVTAYISGHDHCLEHLETAPEDPVFILTGAGKECCYNDNNRGSVPLGSLLFSVDQNHRTRADGAKIDGGFGHVNITKNGLVVSYLDQTGTILYTSRVVPGRARPDNRPEMNVAVENIA